MPYSPAKGDYVSYESADGKVKYGRVQTIDGDNITIRQYEDGKDSTPADKSTFSKLQKSNWARMKIRMKPNSWEVAENVGVAAVYHPLIARNKLMDAEFYSFVLADLIHEFVTKGFTEGIADMLLPATVTGDDATALFSATDFSDALRKAPFVVGIQQILQKALFRKSWGHQLMSNAFGDFAILAISNVGDRMWSGTDEGYTYK